MLEIDEKISKYQKALDDVVNQLRVKRSELATLAKKTVSDIEVSIPKLQSKVNELRAESQKLDMEILAKQQQYRSEKSSFLAEFEAMKKSLQDAHDAKIRELSDAKIKLEKDGQEVSLKSKTLDAKIAELDAAIKANGIERQNSLNAIANLAAEKEKAMKEISNTKSVMAEIESVNRQLNADLKERLSEAEKKSAILSERTTQAEGVIARIKEANATLAKAVAKEAEVKKREEKVNADAVEVLAKQKRQSLKDDEQNKRDELLRVRENNIKIAEQKIAQ